MCSGAVAQLGERRLCKPEVVGSNPISSTKRGETKRQGSFDSGDFEDVSTLAIGDSGSPGHPAISEPCSLTTELGLEAIGFAK